MAADSIIPDNLFHSESELIITNPLLKEAYSLIVNHNGDGLLRLIEQNKEMRIDESDFQHFINSFPCYKCGLNDCVNINGSGGSGIPKLNITSIACIYVAAITDIKVVKTGSRSSTSLVGSSDLFDYLGLLHAQHKQESINTLGFAYYDFLQLSTWKCYRDILSINPTLHRLIDEGVFFDYPAKTYIMGIARPHYYELLTNNKYYNSPGKLISYYTCTEYGIIDEICQGDVFINKEYFLSIEGSIYLPQTKEEVIEEDMRLLYGTSENNSALASLRYTTSVIISILSGCDIEAAKTLFDKAYDSKIAGRLMDSLKILG